MTAPYALLKLATTTRWLIRTISFIRTNFTFLRKLTQIYRKLLLCAYTSYCSASSERKRLGIVRAMPRTVRGLGEGVVLVYL